MTRSIPIIQLGLGGVGRALARQLLAQHAALAGRYGVRLDYLALVDRSGALHSGRALGAAEVGAALAAKEQGRPLADLAGGRGGLDWRELLPAAPALIIDTTASDGMQEAFVEALAWGHRLVLANKRPLCADGSAFRALTAHGATRYEATVGAGLPVISTLQALLDSGDRVLRIEAALSGTLGYLCSELEAGRPLSQALGVARNSGWTEPDPRDDLSGQDVARKTLILARTCGFDWNLEDVPSQPWYPTELAGIGVADFMERVHGIDENFRLRLKETHANGAVLRYVATIEQRGARVGFRELPPDHALAALRGADNLIAFTSTRYNDRPLVVRGPGAGQEVTAAGVLADALALAREIPA
jgi:homoserine dehydrogenase